MEQSKNLGRVTRGFRKSFAEDTQSYSSRSVIKERIFRLVCFGEKGEITVLPATEIVSSKGCFFDFEAKLHSRHDRGNYARQNAIPRKWKPCSRISTQVYEKTAIAKTAVESDYFLGKRKLLNSTLSKSTPSWVRQN